MTRVPVLALQVHLGQTGHALQTRRALWSYYHHVYRLADDQRLCLRPRELRGEARREIVGLMCLLLQMGTDLRTPIDGCITASDACETGLGVSRTVDLSECGRSTVLTQTLGVIWRRRQSKGDLSPAPLRSSSSRSSTGSGD